MLSNPSNRVEVICKKKRRHQSLKSDRLSIKNIDSDGIIHVRIRTDHKTHSIDDIKLKNKPSSYSENKPKISSNIDIISPKETTESQVSPSSLNKTSLTNVNDQNSKHCCLCTTHCSPCRASFFLLAVVLLLIALAALIVSILTRPKDTTTTRSMVSILWTFDNNTNDMYNIYNGIAVNGPNYVTSYTGLVSGALNFTDSLSQYVKVDSPSFDFTYRSFTIEIWFYPTLLTTAEFGLFGQCQTMTTDRCLSLMIKNECVYFGFYNDDLSGTTTLLTNRWYHVAFVYDYSTSTQFLYLNGYLEGSQISNKYQGASETMMIGAMTTSPNDFFSGYIEQVSLVTSVKSASEILYDATFVCYYSFDTSPYMDSGPWNFTGVNIGLTPAIGTGRVNNAVSFLSVNQYFLFGGLSLLGTSNQSYSMALWINPTSINGGSIVYVSKCNTNCGSNWCMPFIGLTLSGNIVIQSWSSTSGGTLITLTGPNIFTNVWTHIVCTYSVTNGMRLYLNGLLFQQSSVFSYLGSGSFNYIYLGNFPLTTCIQTSGVISATQYYGILDEYYLYARELTSTEISALANP